jgi:hypothetical protein
MASWPLSWVVMLAAGALSGITALVVAGTSRPRPTTASIAEVMHLELLFGGVLVAVGFGLIGAGRGGRLRPTGPQGATQGVARPILLLVLLAPALVIVHVAATIIVSFMPTPGIGGVGGVLESGVLLLRGWLALLPFGAVGYALGALLRRPMSGLLGAIAFLLVDGLVGTMVSTRLDTWWSPIGNAAAILAASTTPEWARAGVVTMTYVGLALVAAASAAARRPQTADRAADVS